MLSLFVSVVSSTLVASSPALADDSGPAVDDTAARWKADPLFPGAGHGSLGVATGVPFLAMGEAAYAPTGSFAVGAIVGITPYVLGAGIRPRVGVRLDARDRLSLVVPVLAYPTGEGLVGDGAPWFLAQPALRLERRVGDRGYLNAAVGVIGVLGAASRDASGHTVATYNDRRIVSDGTPWGVWNTAGLGGAYALDAHGTTTLFADGMLILRGVRLAGDEWVGGPPVAFTLGLSRVL